MGVDLVVSYVVWMISFAIIGGCIGITFAAKGWNFFLMLFTAFFVIGGTQYHVNSLINQAKSEAVTETLIFVGATIHPEYISLKDGTTITLTKLEK